MPFINRSASSFEGLCRALPMKKTLCITSDYLPRIGGVSNYLFGLLRECEQDDISVVTDHTQKSFQAPHRILRASFQHPLIRPRWLPAFVTAYRHARREKIEYILAGEFLPSGHIALLLKKLLGIPYAVWGYGMEMPIILRHPRHLREVREILQNADRVFTISEYTRDRIRSIDTSIDATIVYPCPQDMPIAPQAKVTALQKELGLEGKTILLTVSRLVKRKGHSHVLRALRKLQRKDLFYLIVGDGPNRKALEHKAREFGLKDFVHFAGEVPVAELPAYYNESDIFCMPNRVLPDGDVEGFGIVFLEANMFGLPVIGGNNGGVPDAIVDRKTGLLVNSESIDDIARAIRELADDPERRKRFGGNGKERVQSEFQYAIQAKKLHSLLSSS